MTKLIVVLLIVCLLVGIPLQSKNTSNIDPEFIDYVELFVERSNGRLDFGKDLYNVNIQFSDLGDDIVGFCTALPWNKNIEIDRKWWENNTSELQKEVLMFHELGHCVLYRSHTSPKNDSSWNSWFERLLFNLGIMNNKGYLDDNCPASYMHPSIPSHNCIGKHYDYYNKELFG